jgi:hypothetical protein
MRRLPYFIDKPDASEVCHDYSAGYYRKIKMQSNAENECSRHNSKIMHYAVYVKQGPSMHSSLDLRHNYIMHIKTHYVYANKLVPSPVCRVCVYQ